MANSIDLFENSGGNLVFVDGDTAQDVTYNQDLSTFGDDVEGWLAEEWEAGEIGPSFQRVEERVFDPVGSHDPVHGPAERIDLSRWRHVATYEDGEVTRHKEGGAAAQSYLE